MTNDTVILTREEVEIAEMLGLTIQQYAHGKREIQKAQEEHEAWLQTPAGVEYMVQKEKETQENGSWENKKNNYKGIAIKIKENIFIELIGE